MLTCTTCGRPSPDGSLFCQGCGRRFDAAAAGGGAGAGAREGAAGIARAASPECPRCHTVNEPGMAFCKMCGTKLEAAAPAADETASSAAEAPADGKSAEAAADGKPAEAADGTWSRRRTGAFASTRSFGRAEPKGPPRAHLVHLGADGRDGESTAIAGESFDIGRVEGDLVLAHDAHLAPRHARITFQGAAARIRALDGVNGVYIRLREPHELSSGDQLLVGGELLRFESLPPEERDPPELVEHGVRLHGSAVREPWGRLRQITRAGTTRNLWHLVRAEAVLGREQGDVTFPGDEAVAPRHAVIRRSGARPRLEPDGEGDTFLRVRGERELRHGDLIRLGDHVLRFESQP